MVHNIVIAGIQRPASAFGIHIKHTKTISAAKVSKALMYAERDHPGVGTSLIPIYYPGGFHAPDDEIDFWRAKGVSRVRAEIDLSKA